MRFVPSQEGVATALPTSFLDLLDKTIAAAKAFKPLDGEAEAELNRKTAVETNTACPAGVLGIRGDGKLGNL